MAVSQRTRTLPASQQELWELIADPHHMPRWWPGVTRMEGVEEDRLTQVFKTRRGHTVRADFRVLTPTRRGRAPGSRRSPGPRSSASCTSRSSRSGSRPAGSGATEVTIVQQQKLRGYSRTGGFLLRRAARDKLDEALDGLERICRGAAAECVASRELRPVRAPWRMIVPGVLGLAWVSTVTISCLKCEALAGSPPAVESRPLVPTPGLTKPSRWASVGEL